MPWNRGRYYTRSKKVNGRIIREYIGGGPLGELAALMDEEDREARERQRREINDAIQSMKLEAEEVSEIDAMLRTLFRIAMTAAGFHQHQRGSWRRKRERSEETQDERDQEDEAGL